MVGEALEVLEAEGFQEIRGGGVEPGFTGGVCAGIGGDELFFEKDLNGVIDGDAADVLDGGFRDGLSVSDDGECLE